MRRLPKIVAATAGAALAVAAALFLTDRRPRRPWRRASVTGTADRARLALDTTFGEAARTILVRAEGGLVTLRGEVDEMGDIARYEAAVRSLPGVEDVDNLIRLRLFGVARPSAVTA